MPSAPASMDRHDGGRLREVMHATGRGAIAAMAMTGARTLSVGLGIVEEPPPEALAKQKARGVLQLVPPGRRRAAIELAHWSYGAVGGVVFGVLPEPLRRRAWAGPTFGLLLWLAFEAVIAPGLGLSQAKRPRVAERVALAADHILYGLVLSETRRPPPP